jgi:predicted dehydrogenase
MNASVPSAPNAPATRRQFLKHASAATAVTAATGFLKIPVYGQSQAPSPGRVLGANDRLVVAVIGLERGKAHINGHAGVKNVEVGYVCDVDSTRVAAGQKLVESKQAGRAAAGERDYRRLLDNKAIDAISIATPNYWHALMAIQGCAAGKHVYVEKPGSHNPYEAEAMVAAAQKHGRVVQMGNQRRSYPMVREAMQRLRCGRGRVRNVPTSTISCTTTGTGAGPTAAASWPTTASTHSTWRAGAWAPSIR